MNKYQVAIVGSGSGGCEAALLAAKKGYQVLLIEKGELGGTRLHHGSFAVRALHASARLRRELAEVGKYGIETDLFTDSMAARVRAQRAACSTLAEELRVNLEKLNVRVAFGSGSLTGDHQIRITFAQGETEDIEADYIILATGSRPGYHGESSSPIINSDQLLDRTTIPAHLFIVGGGYIGCEMAAIYRAFGCKVTLAEKSEQLLPTWDPDVGNHIAGQLSALGVDLWLGHPVAVDSLSLEGAYPIISKPDGTQIAPDLVLVATNRRPNVESLGLEKLSIQADPFIAVDAQLRTSTRNIFAIGDVNGLSLLDSAAACQAQVVIDAITGGAILFSSRWVPRYLDTDPPVAAAGWMESDANEAGLNVLTETEAVKLVTADDKTVADPSTTQVKLIVERQTNRILGCVVIGPQASEVINLASFAIQTGVSTKEIARLLLVHPSASLALQKCAAKFS
jgi:dihydrolipoamide dehydrogenase